MRESLALTAEAWQLRVARGRLPLSGVEDVGPPLDALEASGGAALAEDFRPILVLARAVEAVRDALADADSPRLGARRESLPRFDSLLEAGRRLFAPDGGVRDDASPELARLRQALRRRRVEVSGRMERLLETRRDALGDALLVLRNDRYCLPVLASARSRVPGIVHDRSGSGHTVFVEPLEVIESNNELALLAAEERRETERLLREFGLLVLSLREPLEAAGEALAELDALEAKVEFGDLTEGLIPELAEDGAWTLRGARHPLLDPRLAPLRRRTLGETRAAREVVPLDVELPADRRLLVVSGPNAGGKTVVLKTAALFALLAQAGVPVPAAAGTHLPVFRSVRAEIGDAQAILSDRSTFSSSMEILASILDTAAPGTLAVIDEIGGATDPEEGSALAVAWLEEYLARGGRAIVSTHLSAIKTFAASRPDAVCAAMEFDEATGAPNYRIHPGLSGRSHALSVARERGIPEPVVRRALEILGDAWQARERAESEAEEALERLQRSERELARERDEAREEAQRLRATREDADRERARLLADGLAGFERARRELTRRLEGELDAIRRDSSRHAQSSAADLVAEAAEAVAAEPVVAEAAGIASKKTRDLEVGDPVRVRGLGLAGVLRALEGDEAWLEVGGKRVRVRRRDLEPGATGVAVERPAAKHRQKEREAAPEARESGGATSEINLIGQRLDDAIPAVEKALDDALLSGAARVRVVHGHGTGRLRDGIREHLRSHPAVARIFAAPAREGGNGATIVELK